MDLPSIVNESTRVVAPTWPIQSIVAVNPFWNLREKSFYQVLSQLSNVYGESLFLPLEVFVRKYHDGEIEKEDIERAIHGLRKLNFKVDWDLARFLRESIESTAKGISFSTFSSFLSESEKIPLASQIIDQIAKYCSSYFDQGQASFGIKSSSKRLYETWLDTIIWDKSMDYLGYPRNPKFLAELPSEPLKAIEICAKKLGLTSELSLQLYLMKICHLNMGWCSHIHQHLWQNSLGLSHNSRGTKLESILTPSLFIPHCFII
jgi:uncharacterized protein YbcC (UPF0753/DUF2309 family)